MNMRNTIIWILLIPLLIATFLLIRSIFKHNTPKIVSSTIPTIVINLPPAPQYSVKEFNLNKTDGLSINQLDQHIALYAGYVKKRNEIAQALTSVNRTGADSRTYSPFRSLKIAETYAVNGSILHELYFENLNGKGTTVGPVMEQFINTSFGNIDNFKQDFFDCGNCARGWVITAYSLDDGHLHNFVLEEHNQHVPVLTIPLLVLDVYEHAYMIDYGIKRAPYLDVFWDNINWDVVEQRIAKWVKPLTSKIS